MNARLVLIGVAACVSFVLGGCGEKPQVLHADNKVDAAGWSVSESANPAYIAPGWKPGDHASWDAQLRQRAQTQDEYLR